MAMMPPGSGKTGDAPDMEHDPQLAALYRAGADAQPPARLDDAIRAAARRAVAAGPRRSGARRWPVPVSLAAVVVLSVTVVTMMRERGADYSEPLPPPPAAEAPAAAAKSDAAPPPVAVPQAEVPRRADVPPPAALPAVPRLADPAAVQGQAGDTGKPEQGVAASGSESRAKAAAAADAAVEERSARREQAAPLLRSAPAPMTDATAGAGTPPPAAPGAAASAAAQNALWQDLVQAPPESWLRRIAELRRAGKTADAEVLLVEFRRRFPGERLPDDGH